MPLLLLLGPEEPPISVASDSISLEVVWRSRITIDGGAEHAATREVMLALSSLSSAGGPPTHYRLKENDAEWGAWTTYQPAPKGGGMRFAYTLGDYGLRTIAVQFRDNDVNVGPTASASITVLSLPPAANVPAFKAVQVIKANILVYSGVHLLAELDAVAGSVTADARRAVWRTADLSLSPTAEYTHRDEYDLLVTPGIEVVVQRGWQTEGEGDLIVKLGRFIVDEATFTEGEAGTTLSVTLSDLAARIQRARWTEPYQIDKSTGLVDAIEEILVDRWPDVTVELDAGAVTNTIEAPVVFEAGDSSDPWADAQNLALAHGFALYFDTAGVVQMIEPPDAASVVAAYFYRRDELAVVTATSRVSPMAQTYNGVIVTGEGSSLPNPVRGEAWDMDSLSPTYADGPFGRVPYFYSSPLVTTADQCEDVAQSLLTTVRGRVESLTWEQVPNPMLVPLEAVELEDDTGALHTYILDEITIPLSAAELQTATARETRIVN